MPIGKYIYCTLRSAPVWEPPQGHKCLSASTFTVRRHRWTYDNRRPRHKCLSASTFTVRNKVTVKKIPWGHKCLSASTFTVPVKGNAYVCDDATSQMPIGKYIYCTPYGNRRTRPRRSHKCLSASTFTVPSRRKRRGMWIGLLVTNAYRQVHLLYKKRASRDPLNLTSQMPIGKYIYCTVSGNVPNRLGCVTNAYRQVHLLYHSYPCLRITPISHKCLSASTFTVPEWRRLHSDCHSSHKCLSASTFTVPVFTDEALYRLVVTNAYRQVHLLYRVSLRRCHPGGQGSQMPIGKYIYCTHNTSGYIIPIYVTNAYRQVHLLYPNSSLVRRVS